MKKIKTSIFLIFAFFLLDKSYALDTGAIRNHFTQPNNFTPNPVTFTNTILGIIQWIGFALAICVTLATGIGFLTADARKKALLKDKLWLIVAGILLLAGTVPILTVVIRFLEAVRNEL